ncbi:MAG: hypothetical protein ACP5GT_06285 [Conexivisphaera sp.]
MNRSVGLAALVLILALASAAALAESQGNSLGYLINSSSVGLSYELRLAPPGAHAQLEEAASYLEEASSLYQRGNYSGALLYFEAAMGASGGALASGGSPSPIAPGLNASREIALRYAQKLELEASSITNASLREQVLEEISEAISLLRTQGNASQVAAGLAEAHRLLGEADSALSSSAKYQLASAFAARGNGTGQAPAYRYVRAAIARAIGSQGTPQIFHELDDLSRGYLPDGTIGTYGGSVVVEIWWPLPAMRIGNCTFEVTGLIVPEGGRIPLVALSGTVSDWDNGTGGSTVVGVLNSSCAGAYAYVASNAGRNLVVYDSQGIRVTLYDVGAYASEPAGNITVYYSPGAGGAGLGPSAFLGGLRHLLVAGYRGERLEISQANATLSVSSSDHRVIVRIGEEGGSETDVLGLGRNATLSGNWTGASGGGLTFGVYAHGKDAYLVLPSECSDIGGASLLGENFSAGGPLRARSLSVVVIKLGSSDLAAKLSGASSVQVELYCGSSSELLTLDVVNSSPPIPYNVVLYRQGSIMPYGDPTDVK